MLFQFSQNSPSFAGSGRTKTAESEFSLKNGRLSHIIFLEGAIFIGVPPFTNNTAKTSFGEDFVNIHPAVAEQSRQKKQTQNDHSGPPRVGGGSRGKSPGPGS